MSFGGCETIPAKYFFPTGATPPRITLALWLSLSQIGHCKCQQVLIGLSSNKTANVVKLLTWMQLYWYCRAYLVCLCHLPLELSRGELITVALRAGIAVTHGFVPVAEGATWTLVILFLEQGSANPGEGLRWAVVRMWLLGLLMVCHRLLPASFPVPVCLEINLPSVLVITLVEKVLRDPSGHHRFAALEVWCCSTLYPLPKVFLLVPLCSWKCMSIYLSVTSLCFFFAYPFCDVLTSKRAFPFSLSVHGVPLSFTGYFRALKVVQVLCVNI